MYGGGVISLAAGAQMDYYTIPAVSVWWWAHSIQVRLGSGTSEILIPPEISLNSQEPWIIRNFIGYLHVESLITRTKSVDICVESI